MRKNPMKIFKWLRNSLLVLIFLWVAARLFILGVQHNFPGKTLAHYLEQQVAANTPLRLKIQPLVWNDLWRIHTDQVAWVAPAPLPMFYLFVMEHVEVDFLPNLHWKEFPFLNAFAPEVAFRGQAYGGELAGRMNYGQQPQAQLSVKALPLEQIPATQLLPNVDLRGQMNLQGRVENLQDLQTGKSTLPQGEGVVRLENVTLQATQRTAWMPSWLPLPQVSFSEIQLEVESREFLDIRKLQLKGALEGTIAGQIFLNPQNLLASNLQLHVRLKVSDSLQRALGPIAVLVQRMQCGDVLDFDLSGTFHSLNPPRKRAC